MHNPLSAFVYDSSNVSSIHFENQRTNESVKLLIRQHVVTNLPWIIIATCAVLANIFFAINFDTIAGFVGVNPENILFTTIDLQIISIVYFAGVGYYAILNFLRWYFNVLIVTDKRVIDVNFRPPFTWQTSQAQLEEIQDVRHTQGGLLGIIFNYGNIYVQTAGTRQNITINKIPNPNRVHEIIVRLL